MTGREFTLLIPAPAAFINVNQRLHGRTAATTVKTWRDAGRVHAQAAKLPKLRRARITATLHFGDTRRRDDHNYFPTIKAIIDGLVDYGLLPDDSRGYLLGTTICGGDPIPPRLYGHNGQVVMTILEVI